MWSLCQCEGQNLAKMLEFLQTNIPDSQRTGLYLPTYDCMKKYQGAWHMEQKPIFSQAFLIETAEKDRLQELLGQWKPTADMSRSIAENSIELLPEQENFLRGFLGEKQHLHMSRGHIREGQTYITEGPLRGKEKMIRKIDRHKRLARLELPVADGIQTLYAGLEIFSKINLSAH